MLGICDKAFDAYLKTQDSWGTKTQPDINTFGNITGTFILKDIGKNKFGAQISHSPANKNTNFAVAFEKDLDSLAGVVKAKVQNNLDFSLGFRKDLGLITANGTISSNFKKEGVFKSGLQIDLKI